MDDEERFAELRTRFPALEAFVEPLAPYFAFFPRFRRRLVRAFSAADLEDSLRKLERERILPGLDPASVEQLRALWESRLFRVYLEAIGFAPPEGTDVRDFLPLPAVDVTEFAKRSALADANFGHWDHWKCCLRKTCPELYLEPYVNGRVGCDLASGWGRGALSVDGRLIHCCDESPASLERLERLARQAERNVETYRTDLTALPLPDNSMDFLLGFDIFELLPDEQLKRVLEEALRVSRPGAVAYFKITLYGWQPTLGQVQHFSPATVKQKFTSPLVDGKRFGIKFHDRRAADHYVFEVAEA